MNSALTSKAQPAAKRKPVPPENLIRSIPAWRGAACQRSDLAQSIRNLPTPRGGRRFTQPSAQDSGGRERLKSARCTQAARRYVWCRLCDAHAAKSLAHGVPIGAVAVADEEARRLIKRERFDKLLGSPMVGIRILPGSGGRPRQRPAATDAGR